MTRGPHRRLAPWCVLLLALGAAPLGAQSRAAVLFGFGGLNAPVVDVSGAGDTFGTAFMGGGGLALQIGRATALRFSGTFAGNDLDLAPESENVLPAGTTVKRTFLAGDLQFGIPTSSGLVPYFIVGAGRMSIDPDDDSSETFARFAGRLGTGFNYLPDNSPVVFFVEFGGWFYRLDRLGFDRNQLDLTFVAGLAYAVPF